MAELLSPTTFFATYNNIIPSDVRPYLSDANVLMKPKSFKCPHKPDQASACKCACCVVFGETVGTLIADVARGIREILDTERNRVPQVTFRAQRQVAAQLFYLQAASLVNNAFINPGINPKCCEGYAANILGLGEVILLSVSNAFDSDVPLGTPTDMTPGTVYGNLNISLFAITQFIANAKLVASC